MRECEVRRADAENPETRFDLKGCPAVNTTRQKTNMVFHTLEESLAFFILADYAHQKSRAQRKTTERCVREMHFELARRGYEYIDHTFTNVDYKELPEASGNAPDDFPYEPGDEVTADTIEPPFGGSDRWTLGAVSETHAFVYQTPKRNKWHWDWVEQSALSEAGTPLNEWIVERRKQADRESLLELFERHAQAVCNEVWPGGTIDLDTIEIRWNNRLTNYAGRYYPRGYRGTGDNPDKPAPCIELAWNSYLTHGLAEVLDTLRHELIHAWQDFHPDADDPGRKPWSHHGPEFTQWVDDMNTARYCKHFSRK